MSNPPPTQVEHLQYVQTRYHRYRKWLLHEELYIANEELDIPRHFSTRSIKSHEHYNNTTDNENHSWTLVQKMNIHLWTLKSPQCLHIQSLHPQFHIQDLQGHAHYQHHDPQKLKNKITNCREATTGQWKALHQAPPYPHTRKTPLLPTPPCQLNNRQKEHSFQDHHNTTSTIPSFQDLTDNNHCYYPVHHGDQTLFKDSSFHKYHYTCQC